MKCISYNSIPLKRFYNQVFKILASNQEYLHTIGERLSVLSPRLEIACGQWPTACVSRRDCYHYPNT